MVNSQRYVSIREIPEQKVKDRAQLRTQVLFIQCSLLQDVKVVRGCEEGQKKYFIHDSLQKSCASYDPWDLRANQSQVPLFQSPPFEDNGLNNSAERSICKSPHSRKSTTGIRRLLRDDFCAEHTIRKDIFSKWAEIHVLKSTLLPWLDQETQINLHWLLGL